MRLPAETAPQSGVLLSWPHAGTDWRTCLDDATGTYLDLVRAISAHEPVLLICHDAPLREHVAGLLAQSGLTERPVGFAIAPTNDTWVRDYGPLGLLDSGAPVLIDFAFDGWGGKYAAGLDSAVSRTLHAAGLFGEAALQPHPLVLEGGSIEVDGQGSMLTTTRCLLGSARNPGADRQGLECLFDELLGVDRVLWLDHGALEGDDTDGHVDMLARFCDPRTVAYTQCRDPADPNHAGLAAMEVQLLGFSDRRGDGYRLVPLPLPRAIHDRYGQRLPASYANFLVINGAVLVPVYDDPADDIALERLAGCFPGREILPVDCRTLIRQYGSLHCATMQLPQGIPIHPPGS